MFTMTSGPVDSNNPHMYLYMLSDAHAAVDRRGGPDI